MADYKIKSNLNLYGNSINNFAIQADSGFPASPIMGRTQFYTGGGEYANHIVVYDGKSWKAVAYTDDVKNNADFINLKARVDAFLDGGVNSNDVLDNLREIQQFLDTYGDTTKLVDLLGEINEDIAEQADRISDLESKATQVSVSQTITAGKEIGKVTIDGNTTKLYAPANYAWNEISGVPNTLAGYGITDAINTAGGTITGNLLFDHTAAKAAGIKFKDHRIGSSGYYDNIITITNSSDETCGVFGLLGYASGVEYYHIGHNGSSGNNLRIYKDKVTFGADTLLHTGNYATFIDKTHARTDGSNASGTWNNSAIGIYRKSTDLTTLNFLPTAGTLEFYNKFAYNVTGGFGGENYANALLTFKRIDDAGSSQGASQLGFSGNGNIYYRTIGENSFGSAWKQLAFTDSDITGNAAGLKHSNGTIAAVVNSSGNVTIGSSDWAGSKWRLFVDTATMFQAYNDNMPTLGNAATNVVHIGQEKFGMQLWATYGGVASIQSGRIDGTATAYNLSLQPLGGNVLIGTTTDKGEKLQVNGGASVNGSLGIQNNSGLYFKNTAGDGVLAAYVSSVNKLIFGAGAKEKGYKTELYGGDIDISSSTEISLIAGGSEAMTINVYGDVKVNNPFYAKSAIYASSNLIMGSGSEGMCFNKSAINWHNASNNYVSQLITFAQSSLSFHQSAIFDNTATINGKLYANAGADITGDVYVDGNVHITGNLFAEKELGGGGVGTPSTGGGTGGGSAASGLFAVKRISEGVQSITLNHGLDTRNLVICIYEKDENALTEQWNMCLTDVEIISEMEIRVSFGSATTTEHKVVIMGAA